MKKEIENLLVKGSFYAVYLAANVGIVPTLMPFCYPIRIVGSLSVLAVSTFAIMFAEYLYETSCKE